MEKRQLYVVVANSIETDFGKIKQPKGRQTAQAAHAAAAFCFEYGKLLNAYTTTIIILQARDSAELQHIMRLAKTKKLRHVAFYDENLSAYGDGQFLTAVAIC